MDLPRRDGARARMLALITSLIALAGLIVAAGGRAADIPAGNLTTNPSFESGTTDWDSWQSSIAAVAAADAPNGSNVVQVTRDSGVSSYNVERYFDANTPTSARGGQTYTASAWVKGTTSTAGKTVKLRMREWSGTSVAGSAEASVTLNTTGYQQVTLTYTAKTTGQAMTLDVLREGVTASESFYVDAITLTAAQPALIPTSNVVTNPSFETDVADWDSWHGTLAHATLADAPAGGAAAQVTRAGTNSAYDIEHYYAVNSADSAQADHTYALNAWVRGTSTSNGKTAKLQIHEWNPNRSLAGWAEQTVTLDSAKFKLVQLSYVAHTTGNALTVEILREDVTAAESFYADAFTMTVSDPLPGPNVWDNPSFETDTSEWSGWQADVARVTQPAMPDPPDGLAAIQVSGQPGHDQYALDSYNASFSAGNYTYDATAWVKGSASTDDKTVSLRLREWNAAGQLVGSSSTPVTLDSAHWKQVDLSYQPQATGNAFELDILSQAVTGPETFYADAITMTRTAPAAIPDDNLIANPSFETDASGWDSWNGDALARVTAPTITDAPEGSSVVKISQSASPPDPDQYNLDYWSGDPLLTDNVYTVSAWVKGTPSTDGKTVTLRLREYGTGSQVLGSETEPITLEDDRFKEVQLTYQALGGGTAFGLDLLREDVIGPESFYADAFTMHGPRDTTAPSVQLSTSPPAADGSSTLQVDVTDPGTASTGVTHVDVYAGETLIRTIDQPCASGGCEVHDEIPLSAAQSPELIELTATADDRYGNTNSNDIGKKAPKYPWVGFNDVWNIATDDRMARVEDSNANTIRLYVDFCDVSPTVRGGTDWNWNANDFQTWLEKAHDHNLNVVMELLGRPRWMRYASCPHQKGDVSTLADDYEAFARAVLDEWGGQQYGIVALEAWNEPNIDKYWGTAPDNTSPVQWAHTVNRVDTAVNDFLDTHPARTLPLKAVTGGLTPSAGTHGLGVGKWLNLALPELHSGIGGVGVHLYANGADTDNQSRNSIVDEWDTVGQALSDNGFGDVPRWITEIGFAAPATSEETQEHRLMDIYSRFANVARVKAFIIHRLIDGSGNTADPSGNFGLLQDVSTKRSGYCRLTNSLGGSSSLC